MCALATTACSGSIVDAVTHITIGGMLYFPMQVRARFQSARSHVIEKETTDNRCELCGCQNVHVVQIWLLREHVNWPLALDLSVYLEIGLVAGTYVLVSFDSPWILRSLGLLFFIVRSDE